MFYSDLPLCRASGIGAATNEISRRDGRRADMHPLEDRSFHFSVDEFGLCVYGLFDGFGGSQVNIHIQAFFDIYAQTHNVCLYDIIFFYEFVRNIGC